MDKPVMVEILDVSMDSKNHRTFTLDIQVNARPGQFCMLWIPELNEKPMGFSRIDGNAQITVKRVGGFTNRLFTMDAGDMIGFRGPYGRGFDYMPSNVCIVGGGCGIAPLKPLAKKLKGDAIISSKSADDVLFEDYFRDMGFEVHIATDDGSKGEKAMGHELFCSLISKKRYECVYACGPEPMMAEIAKACNKSGLNAQFSLERYMKCGIGLCGSCSLSGKRVCVEGPVFRLDELEGTEFGRYFRDSSGSKRRL